MTKPGPGRTSDRLKATYVGYRLRKWIQAGPVVAQVHGVFQRACNLAGPGGRLITLLAPARPGPATIVVPNLEAALGRVANGQSMILTPTRVEAPAADLAIDLASASIWEAVSPPNLPLPAPSARYAAIRAAVEIAQEREESPGLIDLLPDLITETPLDPVSAEVALDSPLRAGTLREARSVIRQLGTILPRGELEAALACATRLIGLGPGLTPAGDDVLTGLMLVLHYADRAPGTEVKWIDAFCRGVVDQAMGRTTWVSSEQLRYAAHGEAAQAIAEAAIALLWAQEPLRPAIAALLDTGSSSGSDLLSGMCIGSKLLLPA